MKYKKHELDKKNWGWITVTIIGILPLISIFSMINIDFSGAGSGISMDTFTVSARRPGELPREVSGAHMAVKETGEWAIRWLVVVLSLTPFAILTSTRSRFHVRQAAGITAFVYSALHLLFFCIDRSLIETFRDFSYILGFIATVIMLVLAITSNKKSIRILRNLWKKVHRLAYLAGFLAVIHVILLEHGDWIPYAIILFIGFMLRIPAIRQSILKLKVRKASVPSSF